MEPAMRIALALATLALAGALPARDARACGNSMRWERRAGPNELLAAEKKLRAFQYAAALELASSIVATQEIEGESATAAEMTRAHRIAGLAALGLGRADVASQYLDTAYKRDPSDKVIRGRLGEALVRNGKSSAGRPHLEAAAKAGAVTTSPAWCALARARRDDGDVKGALEAVKEALRLDPTSAEAKVIESLLTKPEPKPADPKDPRTT
jgi:predicted Zn-dependent protease